MCWQKVLTIAELAAAPFTGGASVAAGKVAKAWSAEKQPKTTPDVLAPGPLFPNPGNFADFLMRQGAVGANPFSGAWPSGGFGGE